MSSEAKNLEVIAKAIKQHNENCNFDAVAVAMNPFELERLDWDEIMGIPIIEDSKLSTGMFRIICEGQHTENEEEVEEVIADSNQRQKEVVTV